SDRPVVVAVRAHQLRQHQGVTGIGLGARGRVALPVAAGRQWVDRIDLVAGGDQGLHEQARSVSMPTTTSAGSEAWAATRAWSWFTPSRPSGTWRLASFLPASSMMQMSWWASAQSSP